MDLIIPAFEHGLIRIFTVPTDITEATPEAIEKCLGTTALEVDFIEVFSTANLGEMTVVDYLRVGYELELDAVDQAALTGWYGTVMLVMSRAARGREVELTLGEGVAHITTIGEPARLHLSEPMKTESSQGVVPPGTDKPRPSDAAMSGRIAMVALLVLFLLVAVMIWIAA